MVFTQFIVHSQFFFISIVISSSITAYLISLNLDKNFYEYIPVWLSLLVLFYFLFDIVQLIKEFHSPNTELMYTATSVTDKKIDHLIYHSCKTGKLIIITTNEHEKLIIFPKYSSSYDCNNESKKYLIAFILKKIKLRKKVEYCEVDNTKQILQNADLLIRRNNDLNSLFEEIKTDSTNNKRFSYKPYPQVSSIRF